MSESERSFGAAAHDAVSGTSRKHTFVISEFVLISLHTLIRSFI